MNESELLLYGEPIKNIPEELYIPPKPLEVTLDSFQGPLDLQTLDLSKNILNTLTQNTFQGLNSMIGSPLGIHWML